MAHADRHRRGSAQRPGKPAGQEQPGARGHHQTQRQRQDHVADQCLAAALRRGRLAYQGERRAVLDRAGLDEQGLAVEVDAGVDGTVRGDLVQPGLPGGLGRGRVAADDRAVDPAQDHRDSLPLKDSGHPVDGQPAGIAVWIRLRDELECFAGAIGLFQAPERDAFVIVRVGDGIAGRIRPDHRVERLDGFVILAPVQIRSADEQLGIVRLVQRGEVPDVGLEARDRQIVLPPRVVGPGHLPRPRGRRADRRRSGRAGPGCS